MSGYTLSANHTTLTPCLEETVQETVEKLTAKMPPSTTAHIVLTADRQGLAHKATLSVEGIPNPYSVSARSADLYAAIRRAGQLAARSWRKQKDARTSKRTKEDIRHFAAMSP